MIHDGSALPDRRFFSSTGILVAHHDRQRPFTIHVIQDARAIEQARDAFDDRRTLAWRPRCGLR